MIPLLVVAQFVIGLFSGIICLIGLLAVVQHFSKSYKQRHKVTKMVTPPAKFNQERKAEWLNTILARIYKESTKSNMLFPIVSHLCQEVAKNEQLFDRISLVDFTLGLNPPKLTSIKIMPDVNGDFVMFFFDFSPELNVNIDLVMSLVKGVSLTIMAGCAVFFQGMKGGVNITIPDSDKDCSISFSEDMEINVDVGARIGDVQFNTDEYRSVWDMVKRVVISFVKNMNIKFSLSMPEGKNSQPKPSPSSKNSFLRTDVALIKPIHYLFL